MIELIKTHNINIFDGFLIKPLKSHSYMVKYDNVQMEYKFSIPIFIYEARVRFRIRIRIRVRVWVWQDAVIKKLLKIFLFIFSIYY